ncbi:MAG: sensor histidine kinase [Acidimicrobiales bacterium]
MRNRLAVAILGVMAAALVAVGVGTVLLVHQAAVSQARGELATEAATLARRAPAAQRRGVLGLLRRAARLDGAVIIPLTAKGGLSEAPPSGLTAADLHPLRLLLGQQVSGARGDLVYAAAPVVIRHPPYGSKQASVQAVVLTRQVSAVPGVGGYFLLTSAFALVLATVAADRLGRRIARPLESAVAATRSIAAGDLSAKVPMSRSDYPELSSLGGSINALAESLARSKGLERQFLMSVSHDLRTPLTSIRGFAEAIADGAATDVERAAAIIASESRRLERLVGDLLELAKLEARRFSLHLGRVDLAEVVYDTAESFRPAAEDAGVSLDIAGSGPHWVLADHDRTAQVLANLVENALKFAAASIAVEVGPGTAEVGPGTAEVGPGTWFAVSDDGPGLPKGAGTEVFDRLYQPPRQAARQVGSGLGLAIVSELVTAMGGTVTATQLHADGSGTRLVVSLRPWGEPS